MKKLFTERARPDESFERFISLLPFPDVNRERCVPRSVLCSGKMTVKTQETSRARRRQRSIWSLWQSSPGEFSLVLQNLPLLADVIRSELRR